MTVTIIGANEIANLISPTVALIVLALACAGGLVSHERGA
jgi:hypothetical protein